MKPQKTGELYDNIALWWQEQHRESSYGVEQINRAISYLKHGKKVLDVGCGSGGRIVSLLEHNNLLTKLCKHLSQDGIKRQTDSAMFD